MDIFMLFVLQAYHPWVFVAFVVGVGLVSAPAI